MSWSGFHASSEDYARKAESAAKEGDFESASQYYRLAAEQESRALDAIAQDKSRTFGITAVSAASLWLKGQEYSQAQKVADKALASARLPAFAVIQLQSLLQVIRDRESRERPGHETDCAD